MNFDWNLFKQLYVDAGYTVSESAVQKYKKAWERRKARLMPYFDEEGRIECKINIAELISSEPDAFGLEIIDQNNAIPDFIIPGHELRFKRLFKSILKNIQFSLEELCTNRLATASTVYIESTGKTIEFPAGTKASKYFKAVIENHNNDLVREYTDKLNLAFSVLLESLRQDAIVVLSINPLDIAMASVHTTGWRSCYALEGAYRTAPLAMLLDESTVLAYAYLHKTEYYPLGIELPKKIWRQWVNINFDQNAALFMKEYPKQLLFVARQVRAMVAGILNTHAGFDPNSTWVKLNINSNRIRVYNSAYIYDDPICAAIVLKSAHDAADVLEFILGAGGIYCFECSYLRQDETQSSFYCSDCSQYVCVYCDNVIPEDDVYRTPDGDLCCVCCFDERFVYCSYCSETIDRYDAHYVDYDFEYYCDYCFNDLYTYCDHCDCAIRWEDAMTVDNDGNYCDDCYNNLFTDCSSCSGVIRIEDAVDVDGEYYCNNCYDELFTKCSNCGDFICIEDALDVGGECYCDNCYDELFTKCSNCNAVIAVDNAIEVDDEYYCDDCYDELFVLYQPLVRSNLV